MKNTNTAAPASDDERGLAAIAAEGATLEGGELVGDSGLVAPGQETPDAPAVASDAEKVAMWATVPRTLGSVLVLAFPELAPVYSDEACTRWGEAMLPVAKKRGWDTDGGSPELMLFLASTPFVLATGAAMVNRKRQARAQPPGRPPAGRAAPAAPGMPPNVDDAPANVLPGP